MALKRETEMSSLLGGQIQLYGTFISKQFFQYIDTSWPISNDDIKQGEIPRKYIMYLFIKTIHILNSKTNILETALGQTLLI